MTPSLPHNQSPDLIVFDLGRVLVQIVDDLADAAARTGRDHLPGFAGDLSAHTRRGGDPEVLKLLTGYETGGVTTRVYNTKIAERTGVTADDIAAVHNAVLVRTFEGLPALLDRLERSAVRTACLSNTNAAHWARMGDPADPAFVPLDRLDFRFASHQIGWAKPAPEAYGYVESATRVSPGGILFFDDLAENVAAGKQRGWRTELVPRLDNPLPWVTERLAAYGVWT